MGAVSELGKLRQLANLTVELHLEELCYEFLQGMGHLIEEAAEQRAIDLLHQLRERHSPSPIQSVAANFKITFPIRNWKLTVKRRDGENFMLSKDFVGVPLSELKPVTPAGGHFDPFE
ncbi:hypothetical protein SLS60_004428 [Paraconiothyrium brasiliense]|uniref:Uncharacterized protein n=1 Tax=Paraconiothyrium brasiliense TaxID=300254 RepID=A0ABR3RL36_9PLEO